MQITSQRAAARCAAAAIRRVASMTIVIRQTWPVEPRRLFAWTSQTIAHDLETPLGDWIEGRTSSLAARLQVRRQYFHMRSHEGQGYTPAT